VAEGRVRGAPGQQLPLTPAPSPSVGRGENGDPLTPAPSPSVGRGENGDPLDTYHATA